MKLLDSNLLLSEVLLDGTPVQVEKTSVFYVADVLLTNVTNNILVLTYY